MKTHVLTATQWVPCPIDQAFAFFSNPENLLHITPAWVGFEIVTPTPIAMAKGTQLAYRTRLRGIPMGWESLITEWDPPGSFADVQTRGPYRLWRHVHRFETVRDGTEVHDHVEYAVPGWWLEPLVQRFVARDLARIFAYRREAIGRILGGGAAV